jgi:Mor family transcriptional regulator
MSDADDLAMVRRDAEAEIAAARAAYGAAQMRVRRAKIALSALLAEEKRLVRVAREAAKLSRNRAIYQRHLAGGTFDDLSREFRVSKRLIVGIIRREQWRRGASAATGPRPAG